MTHGLCYQLSSQDLPLTFRDKDIYSTADSYCDAITSYFISVGIKMNYTFFFCIYVSLLFSEWFAVTFYYNEDCTNESQFLRWFVNLGAPKFQMDSQPA